MCVSSLGWWRPGVKVWGVLSAGVWITLILWLWSRTTGSRRGVAWQGLHAGIALVCAVLAMHAARASFGSSSKDPYGLAGGLDASFLHHGVLLSLGVLLTQDLLPHALRHAALLPACGLAMALGPALAVSFTPSGPGRGALVLLGLAGAGVVLANVRRKTTVSAARGRVSRLPTWVRYWPGALAGLMGIWLALLSMGSTGIAMLICAPVFAIGSVLYARRRVAYLVLAALLAGGGIALGDWSEVFAGIAATEPLGRGEAGPAALAVEAGGLRVLAAAVGWVGAGGLVLSALIGPVGSLISLRKRTPQEQTRGLIWISACLTVASALVLRRGLYIPACTMGFVFLWGLLPGVTARRTLWVPGLLLVGFVLCYFLLLGVLRRQGLAVWSVLSFGGDDRFLHLFGGFVMASVLSWWMGARRPWLGLTAIVLAVAAGAAGEWVQGKYTSRSKEMQDFTYHCLGCGLSVLPYLLCMGSRLGERRPGRESSGGA